jgi:NAD(P)-dependent dehydrogenase (short-subunit alcohol dehydrogenase family)
VDLGLRDRVAIVTGASRGIGRHVALALAAEGCSSLLCGRDDVALAHVALEVEELGVGAAAMSVDLADPAAAVAIVEACTATFGRVDILVNNAGGGSPRRLEDLTDEDWRVGFEVNFFAAARLASACVPLMRDRGWGRIVNVASSSGREPDPAFAPYSAAKAALLNLSKALSRAYATDGVLSTCVVPGVTMTELVNANASDTAMRTGRTPEEVMARLLAKQPVDAGRFGQPEEIAAAVVFLASEQASWITGAALAVDGGTLRAT